MRKFDFIDFLLWNSDEHDFYSYQKFNISLDNYEVESVFETNEIFYQLFVEQERIKKIKDKVTWHCIVGSELVKYDFRGRSQTRFTRRGG